MAIKILVNLGEAESGDKNISLAPNTWYGKKILFPLSYGCKYIDMYRPDWKPFVSKAVKDNWFVIAVCRSGWSIASSSPASLSAQTQEFHYRTLLKIFPMGNICPPLIRSPSLRVDRRTCYRTVNQNFRIYFSGLRALHAGENFNS